MHKSITLTLAILVAPAATFAEEEKGAVQADVPKRSPWVFRGGANLDLNQSINLGGTSSGARVNAGLHGGVGYLITERITADLDANLTAYLNPIGLGWFELIPGARARVLDNIQVHVGVPIPLYPQPGFGVLGGLAWGQPLASNVYFVVGLDYTYYFTEYYRSVAPQGRLDVHAGLQTHF